MKLTKDNALHLLKTAIEHKKEWEDKVKARYAHQTSDIEFI